MYIYIYIYILIHAAHVPFMHNITCTCVLVKLLRGLRSVGVYGCRRTADKSSSL